MTTFIARVVLDGTTSHTVEWHAPDEEELRDTIVSIARPFMRAAVHDVGVELRREGARYDGKRYYVRHALEVTG